MRKLKLFLFGVSLLTPMLAVADGATSTVAAPATTQDTFKITGYVDGSYNNLARNYFTSENFDRVFDLVPNGLTLQQGAITLAYQPSAGWGYVLNPLMGRDANGIASYGWNPQSQFDSQTFAVVFPQAFIQNVQGSVTLMAGTFLTLVGYEQIDPTADVNFSRSILFYSTPDTHTGVRGIYVINDKVTLTAGINNGWDNIRDWGRRKTGELSLGYVVNPLFSFTLTGLNGQERATPRTDTGPMGIRTLIDLVATLNATEKLTLVANYDYGWQTQAALPNGTLGRAGWQGLAGYANYKLTEKWQSSLRAEIFEDTNGYRTGIRQNWRDLTLTLGYSPLKNLLVHAEVRHDFSNKSAFTNSNGVDTNYGDQSYALEAYYKFG